MAGLFETAETQRQAQVDRLSGRQVFRSPVEQESIYGAAGAALGRYVRGKWEAGRAEDAAVAERERQGGITGDADLTTSRGTLIAAKRAIEAGDQTLADSLISRGKSLGDLESQQSRVTAAADKAAKADKTPKVTPPSGNELKAVRAGLITRQDEFGENMRSIIQSEDVFKIQEVENMVNQMALVEKTIVSQLAAKGKRANPLEVRQLLNDTMAASQVVSDDSWFGGVFGREGVIDIKAQEKLLAEVQDSVFTSLNAVKTRPIETGIAQRTTGDTVGLNDVIEQDVKGSVEEAGTARDTGQKLENPPKQILSSAKRIKEKISQLDKAIDRTPGRGGREAILKIKAKEEDKLFQLESRFGTL